MDCKTHGDSFADVSLCAYSEMRCRWVAKADALIWYETEQIRGFNGCTRWFVCLFLYLPLLPWALPTCTINWRFWMTWWWRTYISVPHLKEWMAHRRTSHGRYICGDCTGEHIITRDNGWAITVTALVKMDRKKAFFQTEKFIPTVLKLLWKGCACFMSPIKDPPWLCGKRNM